jgi:hypothetical protein
MSLEENKSNVELKELYANVLEAGNDYDNLPDTYSKITAATKLKLKNKIETLKKNNQYESQSTDEEKAKIDAWYQSSIS